MDIKSLKRMIRMLNRNNFIGKGVVIVLFFMTACIKEGPIGPVGPAGTDGVDGNVVCLECHNLSKKAATEANYYISQHAKGDYVDIVGGLQECAMCHSHEGFLETRWNGADTTNSAEGIAYPGAFTCVTCHDFHATLDFENDGPDYAIRDQSGTDLMLARRAGGSEVLDFGNANNLCVKCHQARIPAPDVGSSDSFTIAVTNFGPHHGPQANTLYGWGLVEIVGSESYPREGTHPHYQFAGCTGCHMGGVMNDRGGHTFNASVNNCKPCHTDATSFNRKNIQTDVKVLLDQIEDELESIGIVQAGQVISGTYAVEAVMAAYNWKWLAKEDRSLGVHNPDYIMAVLKNTLASL
jgi:hypothetical protein